MEIRFIRKVASLLGLALLALGLVLGQAVLVKANPAILYVAPGSGCTGIPGCYANIQAAVDAAVSGDEIHVAAGSYTDIHNCPRNDITTTGNVKAVVCLSKTVTISGGYNANFNTWNPATYVTTLNAKHHGRGIYITGNISPTIEDLSITGGDATGLTGYSYAGSQSDVGGGVYVMTANATLKNNLIFSNTAPYGGGGVFLGSTASQLNSNIISNNTANAGGGGMFLYLGSETLTGNTIKSNTSNNLAGGLYLFDTSATLNGNTIAGNTTTGFGGGVDVASCDPVFNDNIISGNTASSGGGVFLWYSDSIFTNNVIADNHAHSAGGIRMGGSQPELLHTTIARNTGGDGSGVFATDDGNTSKIYSTVMLTNTILVYQTVGITITAGSTATLNGMLWFDNGTNTGGTGTIHVSNAFTGNPAFATDGYHLTIGSAAIDKGINACITTDIDGQPRFGAPDLGADEYWAPGFPKYIYMPLITRNH